MPCSEQVNGSCLQRVRRQLEKYPWYRRIYAQLVQSARERQGRRFVVPAVKGGFDFSYCEVDHQALLVEEDSPQEHRCSECGRVYRGAKYDAHWATVMHHRASGLAQEYGLLYAVEGNMAHAEAVRDILMQYAERYLTYPNEGNHLGPARPLHQTVNEAQWISGLALGLELTWSSGVYSASEISYIEENLFRPCAELIRSFDEGRSNRQTWYNAAVAVVGSLFQDEKLVKWAVWGEHGLSYQLHHSVHACGLWYEGFAYHLFALAAVMMMAEACLSMGLDLYREDFDGRHPCMLLDAPLRAVYPDLTLPDIKDGGYGKSLARPQYLAHYEVAFARTGQPEYAAFLQEVYGSGRVKREELIHLRAFLHLVPELPARGALPRARSVNLEGLGLGILRNRVDHEPIYAYLDYGEYGGGHGHPDRLNISLYAYGRRWLTDPGTCPYGMDMLQRWYRQTLAHNTVVVDEESQRRCDGRLVSFQVGEEDQLQLVTAIAEGAYAGVVLKRTIALWQDLLFDIFSVSSEEEHLYDLPMHSFGSLSLPGAILAPGSLSSSGHGYDCLEEVHIGDVHDCTAQFAESQRGLLVFFHAEPESKTTMITAKTPSVPTQLNRRFPVVIRRRRAAHTVFESVLHPYGSAGPRVHAVERLSLGRYRIRKADGTTAEVTVPMQEGQS